MLRHINEKDAAKKIRAARKIILTKIRCTLVRNPYDVGGRKLAIAAKNLFIRKILKENKWYHKITDALEIPKSVKRYKCYRLCSKNWAIIVALLVVLRGSTVYWYDIYSDYAVIKNIEQTQNNFQFPKVLNTESQNSSRFLLNLIENPNVDFIKNPCDVLKWVEDTIRAKVSVYEYMFYEASGVRIVPKKEESEKKEVELRNKEHIYGISDSLELIDNALRFFNNTCFRVLGKHLEHKRHSFDLVDIPNKLDSLISLITKKTSLNLFEKFLLS